MREAADLCRLLWTAGHGEIRSWSKGARSAWCVAGDEASLAGALEWASWRSSRGESVGCGVNPRSRMRHPCGRAEDVPAYVAAVLDFDTDPEAGLARLRKLGLEPSVVVHSGRGMHAYLLLDGPEPADAFRPVAKALCDATGSDAVHDPGRILRLPGTVNPRTGTVARILAWRPGLRWSGADLRKRLSGALDAPGPAPAPPAPPRGAPPRAPTRGDLAGGSHHPSRSEATMGAARTLWWAGLSEDEALARLRASRFAGRSDEDLIRVVRKVWDGACPLSRIEVVGTAYRADGTFLKVSVVCGARAGESWWQRIDGVEDRVEACLGASRVGAQGAHGDVLVAGMLLGGRTVPRVRAWLPREGRA